MSTRPSASSVAVASLRTSLSAPASCQVPVGCSFAETNVRQTSAAATNEADTPVNDWLLNHACMTTAPLFGPWARASCIRVQSQPDAFADESDPHHCETG